MFSHSKQIFNLLKSTKTMNGFLNNTNNNATTTKSDLLNLRGFSKVASKTKKSKENKLILLSDVQSLGVKGESVIVKKGFARNFLLPTKKAVIYSDQQRMEISPPSVRKYFYLFIFFYFIFFFFIFFDFIILFYFIFIFLFLFI